MPRPADTLRLVRSLLALAVLTVLSLAFSGPAQAYGGPMPLLEEDDPRSSANSESVAPAARTQPIPYAVVPGDTVYGIAARFGLSPDTIIWANGMESRPDKLSLGQVLVILPVDGVLHEVAQGETLAEIAARYRADVAAIQAFPGNQLSGNAGLKIGQKVVVPGGTPPPPPPPPPPAPTPEPEPPAEEAAPVEPAPAPAAEGAPAPQAAAPADAAPAPAAEAAPTPEPDSQRLSWPIRGRVSQGFRPGHRAIDILGVNGEPEHACRNGVVAVAGWSNGGWGYYVVIDHGDGFRTLYAHLSRIDVQVGQQVQRGEAIGLVGDTGRATAYHVHLELYQNGGQIDPMPWME